MDADDGMSKHPTNKAGAKCGTGYCDSQCPETSSSSTASATRQAGLTARRTPELASTAPAAMRWISGRPTPSQQPRLTLAPLGPPPLPPVLPRPRLRQAPPRPITDSAAVKDGQDQLFALRPTLARTRSYTAHSPCKEYTYRNARSVLAIIRRAFPPNLNAKRCARVGRLTCLALSITDFLEFDLPFDWPFLAWDLPTQAQQTYEIWGTS